MSGFKKKSLIFTTKSPLNFLKNIFSIPKLIQTQQQLIKVCSKIQENTAIAIDTEFMRERTYYPLLCLIQINIAGKCFAIDPLAENIDLKPFFSILENKKIIKIFHSSHQDIEVLSQITKKIPRSIIDTQVMANFCGFDYNISYAKLSKELLGKNLDKNWQRSDWQSRPLHPEQIEYALIDVLHLPKIYKILNQKLIEVNKANWFDEEMENMLTKKNYDTDNQDLYKKFSLMSKNNIYKENIKLLVPWRDNLAKSRNVPRSFIVKDDVLIKIANFNPSNLQELEKCSTGNKSLNTKIKKEILSLLENKIIDSNKTETVDKINFRLNDKQNSLYQKTKNLLQKKSGDYNLKSEFIINQNDLKQIILGNKKTSEVLTGWRYEVLGENLEKLISENS